MTNSNMKTLILPFSDESLGFGEFALRGGPTIIDELLRNRTPYDLQPRQHEIQAITQTVFRDGVGVHLRRYATRSSSSALSYHSGGSCETDARFGSDTVHRRHQTSLPSGSSVSEARAAISEAPATWAPEQLSQGLGVRPREDEAYALDQIDFQTDWNFDDPWPS